MSSLKLPVRTSGSQRQASSDRTPSSRGWVLDESRHDTERIRLRTGPLLWANGANLRWTNDTTTEFHTKLTQLQLWDHTFHFFLSFFPHFLWTAVCCLIQIVQMLMWWSRNHLTLEPLICFVLLSVFNSAIYTWVCTVVFHSLTYSLTYSSLCSVQADQMHVFATSLDLCRFISHSVASDVNLHTSDSSDGVFVFFRLIFSLSFSLLCSSFLISPPLGFFRSGVECFFFFPPPWFWYYQTNENEMQIRDPLILYKTSCFLPALVCSVARDKKRFDLT